MDEKYKDFLLSFKSCRPQWDLLGLPNAEELPAVRWKLLNLEKMGADKRKIAIEKLERVLGR